MQEKEKINKFSREELMSYSLEETYKTLNSYREMLGVSKFYRDEAAQSAIKDFFSSEIKTEEGIDLQLKEKCFKGKVIKKVNFTKFYQAKNNLSFDNYAIYKNFLSLFEENASNKSSVLMNQDCFTHIGIGVHMDSTGNYTIYCAISQKSLCILDFFGASNGFVIRGLMLEPNCYLFCVGFFKNQAEKMVILGPSKIHFNPNTSQFTVGFQTGSVFSTKLDVRMRKVHFYVQRETDSHNIPYLNQEYFDSNIDVNCLDLAFVQAFNFAKPPRREVDPVEKFLTNEYSFSKSVNTPGRQDHFSRDLNRNIGNTVINQTNRFNDNFKEEANVIAKNNGMLLEFDMTNKSKNNFSGNPSNVGLNIPNKNKTNLNSAKGVNSTFFNPSFNRFSASNVNKTSMGIIQEENSIMLADTNSNYSTINNNSNAPSDTKGGFHKMLDTQLKNNLGSKLQQAEMLRNSQSNQIRSMPVNNNLNNFNRSTMGNMPIGFEYNNGLRESINNNTNTMNTMNNTMNNYMNNNTMHGIGNNFLKSFPQEGNQNDLNYNFQSNNYIHPLAQSQTMLCANTNNIGGRLGNQIQSQNLIKNVMNIPLSKNFKSLLSLKFNTSGNNNNFLLNSNIHSLMIKDPMMNINLARNSDSIGSNMQQCTVIPQTRKQFADSIRLPSKLSHKETGQFRSNNEVKQSIANRNEELNKSSIKFGGEKQKREKDSNIYTIDYFIFKDAMNNIEENIKPQEKVFVDNHAIDEEKKHVNQRILETLSRRYLTENEMKGTCNTNPVFEELFRTMSCFDIVISVNGEDINAHKVVLISQSQIFKEMIQKNENKLPNEIIKIVLPSNYKGAAFKEVLKWIYCGRVSDNLDISFLREMLIIGDSLKIFSLQKVLIVKFIIPNMTKEASIKFIKDAYKKSATSETSEVWTLLANFSLNCIAKNSSIVIKNHRNEFLGMEMDLLFKCIERSVFYLVEDIHLSNLIKIIIDRGFATDVFDLLNKLSKDYVNARNSHIQNIDISSLLLTLSPFSPVEFALINDECVYRESLPNLETKKSEISSKEKSGFNNVELAKNKIDIIDVRKYTSNSPATNYVKDIDLKKNKAPTFSFSFSINYENLTDCSIISESFNTNSRAWNLKIDLSSTGDVGLFLVERGRPIIDHNLQAIHVDKFSMKFNSVLFEFEIRDISFEKSSVIFFSFVSDHNQIVGYENFFNVKQLGKKENFIFNVWIKEFPLHSACLQYVSDNFGVLTDSSKKKIQEGNGNNNGNEIAVKSFYDLLPHDISYILYSDNLKVDSENSVITFVYRYSINKPSNDIDCIMNTIRYKFVDFKILCTTARDHEAIKHSNYFKKHFQDELDRRIKSCTQKREVVKDRDSKLNSILSELKRDQPSEVEGAFTIRQHRERKFFNLGEEGNKVFNISKELTSFFLEKDHHGGYIKEIERLKKLFEEEKTAFDKREGQMINQKRELQMEIQRLNERETKRRKIMAANSNDIKGSDSSSNDASLWVKEKIANCNIY